MPRLLSLAPLLLLSLQPAAAAETFLVQDHQPQAEIVIAETPTRSQRLAAHELQRGLEKISGAKLPIVTSPSGKVARLFVGRSSHTDALKLSAEGLRDGAYRIATGPDWMVFLGDDRDFTPRTPFATNNGDIARAQAEWERLSNSQTGMPGAGLYKHRLKLPGEVGKPDGAVVGKNEWLEIWGLDERGSFNAVCGFLHKLGARWYLPGDLGEVMPSLPTIPLPKLDETVRPDFRLRQFNFRFGTVGGATALWAMRLGIRHDERLQIAHGLATMTNRDAVFKAHPDWFALYGNKRHYTPGYSKNQLCYSNEELFRETVRYVRSQLDTYDYEAVSVMPPDGYTAICQCEKCRGKDSPERHERGLASDYVWEFVNRVAKEIAKTHPKAKVLNCAYGIYTLPPLKIEKLEPNVQVCIVGGRRPISKPERASKSEGEASPAALRGVWAKKTDNPILFFENYPFIDRGWYLPAFAPHSLGDTVNATKGMSLGEDIWLSIGRDFDKVGIGFNHFLVYFTARMYWGGKTADVDALFREYCRLFYGPAEAEMHAFFTYCEAHWGEMEADKAKADTALALFEKAKSKVDGKSVHGQRLAFIDDFLKGLRMKTEQLAQKRGPVPVLRLVGDAKNINIDGRLDDESWQNCPVASIGRLRELQTGRTPTFGTTVKAAWHGNSVYFAIRCDERPGEKPNNTATRDGDQALWLGDAIEIELATETHSYYSIAVSPSGAIVDLDRGAPRDRWFAWDSKAEVATRIENDHWTVEIRIPVTQDENDPLHQVIGRKPTQSLPWHINVCRQRVRADGMEASALSPTGTNVFHVPLKFAHFYAGRSHQFEADAAASDFVLAYREASKPRPPAESLAAFLKLAEGKLTPFQKSIALEQAARAARTLKDFTQADAITAQIPIESVKKTAHTQTLLAQSQGQKVIEGYARESIETWPFWQRGEGYFTRGRAYAMIKSGKEAEADLARALEFTTEPRRRASVSLLLGQTREFTLKDDASALEAYQAVVGGASRIGSSEEFEASHAIARILVRQRKFDEALKALGRIPLADLRGPWKYSTLLLLGETHLAAGHTKEATAAFQTILDDKEADARHRMLAKKRLNSLR